MRILHTSDWHLNKKLYNFDRIEEQQKVMSEIIDIADSQNVDMVIIAGDLFDTYNPSNEAQRLLYKTLHELSHSGQRPVIAIAGNHDSPDRIESPESLAFLSGIFLLGYPNTSPYTFTHNHDNFTITNTDKGFIEIRINKSDELARIIYTPFTNTERLRIFLGNTEGEEIEGLRFQLENLWKETADKYCDEKGINIMVAHQFFIENEEDTNTKEPDDENAINVGGTSAIYSSNIPRQIQYAALGHLHKCQKIGEKDIWYSGSPLEYSFAETNQDKYVIIADIDAGKKPEIQKIQLQNGLKLVRKTFESIESATNWLSNNKDCWVEITLLVDDYLTSADKHLLYKSHDRIVTIIPQLRTKLEYSASTIQEIQKDKTQLFKSYFEKVKGVSINDNLMQLFKEIISENDTY